MPGTIYVLLTGLLCFIYITIVYLPVVFFLPERKSVLLARKAIGIVGKGLVASGAFKIRVTWKKEEEFQALDPKEGIIFVSNHQSNLDIPIVYTALKGNFGFVAKKEMRRWPFYGIWMRKMKCVFLDRRNPREGLKDIKRAVEVVKEGYPMLIFPEGERSHDGGILPFKKGSFKLALDTRGIVVPVTIRGTFAVQKRGEWHIHRGKDVDVIIDEPIHVNRLDTEEMKTLDKRVREIIIRNFEAEGESLV
ncbi:MAG: 1-acyl-sn-glycerol-3-phosphate acyltransferase [Fusobacteriaceae bacterium]|jgi:1-acyl-sn-glycerol-3-phosphate acyltransferase|nr:1-acyl-sn-glycerol-3-phosphate acyltransferase [Fusobacteriaceae bacterium]